MRHWINIVESQQRFYIRFGDIPANERSRIGRSPNLYAHLMRTSDEEVGVSVFDTEWSEERHRWMLIDVGNYASLDELLAQKRPAFLVTGREVGEGIDGEPVLRDVQIVEQVPYNKLYVPGWGNDPLPEEYLDIIAESLEDRRWGCWITDRGVIHACRYVQRDDYDNASVEELDDERHHDQVLYDIDAFCDDPNDPGNDSANYRAMDAGWIRVRATRGAYFLIEFNAATATPAALRALRGLEGDYREFTVEDAGPEKTVRKKFSTWVEFIRGVARMSAEAKQPMMAESSDPLIPGWYGAVRTGPDGIPHKMETDGGWILPDGTFEEIDHTRDWHHATIATTAFADHVRNDDGEIDDHSEDAAWYMALEQGWIRISIIGSIVNVQFLPSEVERPALRALMEFLKHEAHHREYGLEFSSGEYQRFSTVKELIAAINKSKNTG